MNTPRTAHRAVSLALAAVATLAMLAGIDTLYGAGDAETEVARAADVPAQVVVIEGRRARG